MSLITMMMKNSVFTSEARQKRMQKNKTQPLRSPQSGHNAPRAVSDGRSYTSSPGSSVANTSRPSEHEQQKLRLLQTILMRVEHQGQQLDAILQRLSSSTPQSSCMTEDVLQQPFGDIDLKTRLRQ
ncbi:hypothetical protein V5799_010736 [Amblyomma americanum]|uniref:Uncharacterized protein n=1 Tax=Amblyomma americanum TaxID=6943 RepID=A0AAQ4EJ66_AMBAM